MKQEKDKILMAYVLYATFVKRDIEILSSDFIVDHYHFNTSKKANLIFAFIKQFLFLLKNFNKYRAIVVQSSGYISFLPVLFSKFSKTKSVIIAIGTDCAKLPEINYGAHNKTILKWFTNYSFRNASLILPVHKSLTESEYTYLNVKYKNQGIKAFNKNIKTKIVELNNGYDLEKWIINNNNRHDNSFLTVTFALDKIGYYRKGIDLIVKMAKHFSNYNFTIVGEVFLEEECPNNITLIKNVNQNELLNIYNSHKYYFQLSMFEGFPNALCEAMLCGCIPIGSNVAGIPDIIDNKGYILKKKSEENLISIINGLSSNTITSEDARNQIVDNFNLQKRKDNFIAAINNL